MGLEFVNTICDNAAASALLAESPIFPICVEGKKNGSLRLPVSDDLDRTDSQASAIQASFE